MNKRSGYRSRPMSERVDDWAFSAIVLMVGVCALAIAYNLGGAVVMVASK